jgi:uncharacterized membrane protein YjjP (DUF1212 family)
MLSEPEAFVVRAAELLHAYGTPAPRCEATVGRLASALGSRPDISVSPTALLFTFEPCRTLVRRVEPGEVDLGRLVAVEDVLRLVETGAVQVPAARRRLEAIARAAPAYPPLAAVLAHGLVAATAALLFGGGTREACVAAAIGVAAGLLAVACSRSPRLRHLFEPLAAAVAGGASYALARTVVPHADDLVTLASLIVLVPGLSFTVAMVELSTRHWVSGTARLAAAGTSFVTLAFGVALGRAAASFLVGDLPAPPVAVSVPAWATPISLVLASLGFAVLFHARLRELGWIIAAGAVAMLGHRLGAGFLGPELGAFVGALAVGLFSTAYAIRSGRPTLVPLTPGILMLVPGSIGYRALDLFVAHDVMGGLHGGFQTVLVATALVAGLLVAGALLQPAPRRR